MIGELLNAIHADPWSSEFVDLATLNAGASGAVEQAVEKLRREAVAGGRALRSASLVILGPPGAGKTHLFARLRRRMGPRAVFVHIRPLVHAELTARFLLGEVVRQLGFQTPQGMQQASAMVGSLLGALSGVGSAYPSAALTLYTKLSEPERASRLDAALERILSLWPEADDVYLQRLLSLPFSSGPTSRALLAWLSGRDCDAAQLERIGAASSLGEDRALPALQTLSLVAALGAPLVLVFDQLENLIDSDGAGPRLRAYAHLASECVDVLRGTVIVHLALDTEWERGIEPSFNPSQRSRIVMRRELLALPRAAEREELLRLLLERVSEPHEAFPWPLGEKRLERLRTQPGITPRLLLVAFRGALAGESDEEPLPAQPAPEGEPAASAGDAVVPTDDPDGVAALRDIAGEWQTQLGAARQAVHAACEAREPVDAARLADGLLASGRFVPGLRITPRARPPAALQLDGDGWSEQLALVQESNPRTVGAILGKLAALTPSTRVVVVRERARELPPTWRETLRKQRALIETGRARWLDLDNEDAARVLALASLLQAARSGEVTDARGAQVSESEVCEWVTQSLDVPSWPISTGLSPKELADPGGPEPGAGAAGQHSEPRNRQTRHGESLQPDSMRPDAMRPDSLRPDSMQPGQPAPERSEPSAPNPGDLPAPALAVGGATLAILRRLRVASLDRLIREVVRVRPDSTRAAILAELESAGARVGWFGRSIVCLRGVP